MGEICEKNVKDKETNRGGERGMSKLKKLLNKDLKMPKCLKSTSFGV